MKRIIVALTLLMFTTNLNAQSGYTQKTNSPNSPLNGTVTDIDGNVYNTIVIGDQEWMVENLKVTKYRNGDPIPLVSDSSVWKFLETEALCVYDNADSNVSVYGYLYNWYSVGDSRGLAPEGWRIPTDDDWQELADYFGGDSLAGYKLMAVDTILWEGPNSLATNESGFSALPGGFRKENDGGYVVQGFSAYFWSATEHSDPDLSLNFAWNRSLTRDHQEFAHSFGHKRTGYSVRCIRNVTTSVKDDIDDSEIIPSGYQLSQNYPNPFNPETLISFAIPKQGRVTLVVYDILGNEVKTLVSKNMPAGTFNVVWDGTGRSGVKVSSGFYLYRLQTGNMVMTRKMLLLK